MFDFMKFIGGFAFWKGAVVGKLLYFLIIIIACLGIFWKLFLAPSSVDKSKQQAGTITNITHEQPQQDAAFFGIRVGGAKFGFGIK